MLSCDLILDPEVAGPGVGDSLFGRIFLVYDSNLDLNNHKARIPILECSGKR